MTSKIKVDTIENTSGNNIISKSGTTVTLGKSGDTVAVASGASLTGAGLSWQSAVKTANFTAVSGEGYFVNTTGGAFEIDLPTSPSVGDEIEFVDFARKFGTNALTLDQGSNKFQARVGSTKKPVFDTNGQHVRIVYSGSTQGWLPTTDDSVADITDPSYNCDFLCIAGGGSGGQDTGGGGGAGGYRNSFNSETSGGGGSSESSLLFNVGTTYTITIGAGGGANTGSPSRVGSNGNNSVISGSDITDITSTAGGGGGGGGGSPGQAGGSGGGGGDTNGTGGAGTTNQGFAGKTSDGGYAGGGGGAGEVGDTDGNGYGGDGLSSSITASAVSRGGGGAGCDYPGTNTPGGEGGGGNATNPTGNGGTGGANTGGGGGGGAVSAPRNGGAGGSGVVVLRMPTSSYSGTTSGSPTVATSGSDTIITFNASGSYTG